MPDTLDLKKGKDGAWFLPPTRYVKDEVSGIEMRFVDHFVVVDELADVTPGNVEESRTTSGRNPQRLFHVGLSVGRAEKGAASETRTRSRSTQSCKHRFPLSDDLS